VCCGLWVGGGGCDLEIRGWLAIIRRRLGFWEQSGQTMIKLLVASLAVAARYAGADIYELSEAVDGSEPDGCTTIVVGKLVRFTLLQLKCSN
jgi:hypothetical protein